MPPPDPPGGPDGPTSDAAGYATDDPGTESRRISKRKVALRVALLSFTAISLYLLAPSLIQVFGQWRKLEDINPIWFVVMVGMETASFACVWYLFHLAIRDAGWFAIATSQLASNAVTRVIPGGAAAGGAAQYKMLATSGADPAAAASALTAVSLISTATVFALPLLSLPAIIGGTPVPDGLAQAAWIGAGAFLVMFAVGVVMLRADRPIRFAGALIERLLALVRRSGPPDGTLPGRLVVERNKIRVSLGKRWVRAVAAAVGNWGLDYLALLAALTAVGARPDPALVLLAFTAAAVLSMIPITPGGLGFVEAGLTATLALAGVSPGDAAVATLAYRLVSYWLPLPAGGVAYWLFARRYHVHGKGTSIIDTVESATP